MEPIDVVDETPLVKREQPPQGALDAALLRMEPAQQDQLVARIRKAMLTKMQIIRMALHATQSEDWVDFGGKPYLQGNGAMRAAEVAGMHVLEPRFEVEGIDEEWFVECTQTVEWPLIDATETQLGSRDTCDKFFAQPGKDRSQYNQFLELCDNRESVAKRKLLPWLKKSAREGAIARCVSNLLGIRGITWAALEDYGIIRGAGGTVTFKERKDSPAAAAAAKPKPTATRSAKAPAPTMKLNTLETVDIGSVASVLVRITDKKEVDSKRTVLQVKDDTASLSVTAWTTRDPLPEFAEIGFLVQLTALKVGEYNGQRQYSVDATAIKEEPRDATNGLLD